MPTKGPLAVQPPRQPRHLFATQWLGRFCAGIATLLVSCGALAAGQGYEGLPPQEICGLCHALNGISPTAKFPKLAGQKAAYIEKQLRDFLRGKRTNDSGQMASIVTEITPKQFSEAARHFANQPAPKADAGAIATLSRRELRLAESLYESGRLQIGIPACKSCHEGSNPTVANAPLLASQHAQYLAKQLTDFKTGARKNDGTGTMQSIAAKLSVREIELLAAYLASRARTGS